MDRRHFMTLASAYAALAALPWHRLGAAEMESVGATFAPFSRPEVSALSATAIAAFRAGVTAMKARPITDQTSWGYQANVHGTTSSTAGTIWSTCQHRTAYFFPWHRMQLYYFERILRKASGDPSFALPYWNWSLPANDALPAIFRSSTVSGGGANSLYASRGFGVNAGNALPAGDNSYAAAFLLTNFLPSATDSGFGGRPGSPTHGGPSADEGALEGGPHDLIHGDMGGDMGSISTAGKDPIFYLHHANIDRLWQRWLDQGGGRANPTSTTAWMTTKFTFYDENAAQVQLSGAEVLDYATQLNYRYDDDPTVFAHLPIEVQRKLKLIDVRTIQKLKWLVRPPKWPPPPPPPPFRNVLAANQVKVGLGLGAKRVALTLPAESQRALRAMRAGGQPRFLLTLEGISVGRNLGGNYDVFLNLPEGAKPNRSLPEYVGTIGTFRLHEPGDTTAGADVLVADVTDAVAGLARRDQAPNQVRVDIVRNGVAPTAAEAREMATATALTIGRVSIRAVPRQQ